MDNMEESGANNDSNDNNNSNNEMEKEPQQQQPQNAGGGQTEESWSNARNYAWEDTPVEVDEETEQTIKELEEELAILGHHKHASYLLKNEINRLRFGREGEYVDLDYLKPINVIKKVIVPVEKDPSFNYMGKLLGPGGRTLKQLTLQARCRLYILGSGSTRSKEKEPEQLATGEAKYAHLAEPLHVRCETTGPAHLVYQRLGFLFDQMRYLIYPDQCDESQRQYSEFGGPPGTSMNQAGPNYYRGNNRNYGGGYGGGRGGYAGGGYGGGPPQQAYGYDDYSGYGAQQQDMSGAGAYYVTNAADPYSAGAYPAAASGAYPAAGSYPAAATGGGGARGGKTKFGNNTTTDATYNQQAGGATATAEQPYGYGGYVGSYSATSAEQYSAPGKMRGGRGGGGGRGGAKAAPY